MMKSNKLHTNQMTVEKLTDEQRDSLVRCSQRDDLATKVLRIIDGLTAKCDAQAAVIERVRAMLTTETSAGLIANNAFCARILTALAAAPEQTAPHHPEHVADGTLPCLSGSCSCHGGPDGEADPNYSPHAEHFAAPEQTAPLGSHAADLQSLRATQELLDGANARVVELERLLDACSNNFDRMVEMRDERDVANARADAAERAHYAEAEALGRVSAEAVALRAERDAANARVAELEAERAPGYFWKLAEDRLAQLAAKEQQRAELEEYCRSMAEWRDKLRDEADAANARADAAELAHEYQRKLTVEADGRTNDALTEVASLKMQLEACRGVAESEAAALRAELEAQCTTLRVNNRVLEADNADLLERARAASARADAAERARDVWRRRAHGGTTPELDASNARVAELERVCAAVKEQAAEWMSAANARADAAERRAAEETVTHDQLLLEVSSYRSGMQRAESEAAALRAEVERLRTDATECVRPALESRAAERDEARKQLAAANALLEDIVSVLEELNLAPKSAAVIRAHLSGQAPAQSEAMRELAAANALTEAAASFIPESLWEAWMQTKRAHLSGLVPARSEPRLATHEETAKQAAWEQSTWTNAQRTDHERAVLEAMRNARIEQCGSVRRFMSELQEDAVCRAELARREAEKQ